MKYYIAQNDIFCDNCENIIPEKDLYFRLDDYVMCSNCGEKKEAQFLLSINEICQS